MGTNVPLWREQLWETLNDSGTTQQGTGWEINNKVYYLYSFESDPSTGERTWALARPPESGESGWQPYYPADPQPEPDHWLTQSEWDTIKGGTLNTSNNRITKNNEDYEVHIVTKIVAVP